MPDKTSKTVQRAHGHLWLVGVVGTAAGAAILIHAPQWSFVGQSLLALVAIHLVGALLVLSSGAFLVSLKRSPRAADGLNYGWTPGWMNGLGIAAMIAFSGALLLQMAKPDWWPASFALLLWAAALLGGNLVVASFRRNEFAVLPMVRLLKGDRDRVLDAGCGAGRTTVALADLIGNGRVVAVDLFDAGYIEGGGRALLERNIVPAGMAGKVEPVKADLTALPFEAASFDSAVSTACFDHLGRSKQAALNEVARVLKPEGRFLMSVWVPSWSTFLVGNIFSFMLSSRSDWRSMAGRAGLKIVTEGVNNFSWYLLLEKPREA